MDFFRSAIALILILFVSSAYAGSSQIAAPAVISSVDAGVLTHIYLNTTPGNGTISISSGGVVANDTKQSAITAVGYATSYLKFNESKFDFYFRISSNNSNISGPSAGLALTLLAISALNNTPLNKNFTVTGTINGTGSVGPIGGVFDKTQAAASSKSRFILVPYVGNYSFEYSLYYMSQQNYGIPVVEVRNVSQAIPYAFGDAKPSWLTYNVTTNYNASAIPNASTICSSCSNSQFSGLVNMTFTLTSHEIDAINSTKFGAVKSQMSGLLSQYRTLAAKGYLYTGADLAFVEFPQAFVFANYQSSNSQSAYEILGNMSAYCNALNATPQLTSSNYEYILGGDVRHTWAEITLSQAYSDVNSSESSDDIFGSLYSAAPAYSWCAATSYLYNVSSEIGGTPVAFSSNVESEAISEYWTEEHQHGTGGLYVQAANESISNGDYASALYSLVYASVFYSGAAAPRYNSTTAAAITNSISNSIDSGYVWPTQFSLQSYFYLNEAAINKGNSTVASSYFGSAYTTALLSASLAKLNTNLNENFVAPTAPQISGQSATVIYLLIAILIVLIGILIALILHLLEHKSAPVQSPPRKKVQR